MLPFLESTAIFDSQLQWKKMSIVIIVLLLIIATMTTTIVLVSMLLQIVIGKFLNSMNEIHQK